MEILLEVLNSEMFKVVFKVASVLCIVLGILMFIGILTKGRVLLIDQVFKKKEFNRDKLKNYYLIQAIYTIGFGIVLLILSYSSNYDGLSTFLIMILFGVLDFCYDTFAISNASKIPDEKIYDGE